MKKLILIIAGLCFAIVAEAQITRTTEIRVIQYLKRTDIANQAYTAVAVTRINETITAKEARAETLKTVNVNGPDIPYANELGPGDALDLLEGRKDSLVLHTRNTLDREGVWEHLRFWEKPMHITTQVFKVIPGDTLSVGQVHIFSVNVWEKTPDGIFIGVMVLSTILGVLLYLLIRRLFKF